MRFYTFNNFKVKGNKTTLHPNLFPVVMYGCESWTLKKAECQRINVFKLVVVVVVVVVVEKALESPLDCKEIKPVNPKGKRS